MDSLARTLDLTVLILMFLPDVVFLAFLVGVAAYVWYGVRWWCQQGEGPWRERLILPGLFAFYWFVVTYTIHANLIRQWDGAPDFLPWVLLALGLVIYLTDLRRPRFWALYYGAAELIFTLAEQFGESLLAGREMLVATGTPVGRLLFFVVTAAATGVLAFAVHFVVGLFLKLWEENSSFWAGSVGVFICLLLVGDLWYRAPALAATGFAPYVVPAGCLLVLLGFASGYAATAEYCAPGPEGAPGAGPGLVRWPWLEAGRAHRAVSRQEERRELDRQVRDVLAGLRADGFLLLSGVRVLGAREAEIGHLLMGPNGIWVVDTCSGAGRGSGRARWARLMQGPRRNGAAGTGTDPEEQIRDLRAFLERYIGEQAEQMSFHSLACGYRDEQPVWAEGSGEFQALPPAEVRALISGTPGVNPLPAEVWPRIMILLLRETIDRTRRHLEEQNVPDVLPRLEPTRYESLGLSVLASDEEIERRFEDLSRQYGVVDGTGGDDEPFAQIRAAYATLRENRQAYEQWLWQESESTLSVMREIAEKWAC